MERAHPMRPWLKQALWSTLASTLAALVGCGGGGGGDSADPASGANGTVIPATVPAATVVPLGTPLQWSIYQVTVPPTMTATDNGHYLALDKAGCRITLWTPDATRADLSAQALETLKAGFNDPQTWSGLVGEMAASPLEESYHRKGITAGGWPFVELRAQLLNPRGVRTGEHVRILLVDVGGQAAAMIGYQTARGCLDEVLDPYEFVMLSYSMSFPGSTGDPAAMRQALVGGWFGSTNGGQAWSDVFAANSQYSNLFGLQSYQQISPTLIRESFSTWQGNGQWTANGNQLTVWPASGAASTVYFRIYTETGGSTYLNRLGWCTDRFCERWSTQD